MEFSDGTVSMLQEFAPDYVLDVESLDERAVFVGSAVNQDPNPKLLAVGHRSGYFIEVTLRVPSECERLSGLPLYTTQVFIENHWITDLTSTYLPHNDIELQHNANEQQSKVYDEDNNGVARLNSSDIFRY